MALASHRDAQPSPSKATASTNHPVTPSPSSPSPCEQTSKGYCRCGAKVLRANEQSPPLTFARFARNRFGDARPPLLVCSQSQRGEGKAKAEQDDEAMGLFVEAVADHRGGADAVRCRCQGDGCCKDKNQTILGDSLGRQGGRPLSHDGYALVSFLVRRLR